MTTYAKHGTSDYASRTATGCAAAGEPVFLLRGQDKHAPCAVRHWANRIANAAMRDEALRIADEMTEWAEAHGSKEPD